MSRFRSFYLSFFKLYGAKCIIIPGAFNFFMSISFIKKKKKILKQAMIQTYTLSSSVFIYTQEDRVMKTVVYTVLYCSVHLHTCHLAFFSFLFFLPVLLIEIHSFHSDLNVGKFFLFPVIRRLIDSCISLLLYIRGWRGTFLISNFFSGVVSWWTPSRSYVITTSMQP